MANILYVIWWEGTREAGIIENQVYRQLEHTVQQGDHSISLLSGGPFWRGRMINYLKHSSLFSGILRHCGNGWLKHPDALRQRMADHGIDLVFRNTWRRPRTLYLSWWELLTAPLAHLFYFHRLCKMKQVDIVHCRSYFPTWLALMSRAVWGGSYKVIFDTRGLLPEEGISTGHMQYTDITYRVWKQVEAWIMKNADKIVNVSETFTEDLQKHGGPDDMETIYASVDLRLMNNLNDQPIETENELHLTVRQRPALVYLGKISGISWHSIPYLARMFRLFKARFPDAVLLVVTTSDHDTVRQKLEEEGVAAGDIIIRAAHSTEEVMRFLRNATYAALPFRDIRGEYDRRIGHTMIASKLAEYLAAGIPVLCNRAIGGASQIIEKHQVGCVIDLDTFENDAKIAIPNPEQDKEMISRCQATAALFSMESTAHKYNDLYARITTF